MDLMVCIEISNFKFIGRLIHKNQIAYFPLLNLCYEAIHFFMPSSNSKFCHTFTAYTCAVVLLFLLGCLLRVSVPILLHSIHADSFISYSMQFHTQPEEYEIK